MAYVPRMTRVPQLVRQCADYRAYYETHGEHFQPLPPDMEAQQYFSRLSQAYGYFVERRDNLIETRAGHILSRVLYSLKVPNETLDHERQALLEQAMALYTQSKRPTVRQGAAVADMIATIYGYIGGCAATRVRARGELPLACTPNNEDAMRLVRDDRAFPEITRRMLDVLDDVPNDTLDDVFRQDMDRLDEHLALWEACTRLHGEVDAYVARVHAQYK